MPVEAAAFNVLKNFKFRLEINGYPVALVQEFNSGARTHGVTERSGAGQNYPIKEGAMIRFGNAILRNVIPLTGGGREYFEQWMNQVQNPETGNGLTPDAYKRNFTMFENGPSDDPVRIWEFKGGFPCRRDLGNRQAMAETDAIEEIELAYDKVMLRVGA